MANAQQGNVIPMDKSQSDAKPARFTIAAMIDGFPVQVEGKADHLRAMVERLKAIGATPPMAPVTSAPASTKTATPVCPIHRTPMKASRKPGYFFCPRRTDEGEFCPEKA